jgi:hypothetical protein
LPTAPASTDDVLLATRGFDLGLSDRCPALDDAQRCSLHHAGKPAICRVVPLDALSPDQAQHSVLHGRLAQARHWGTDCIEPGVRPGFAVVTRRLSVVDAGARAALEQRRQDLARERRTWGDAVFELLREDLFSTPAALARVPAGGFMTLSIAPVLMVLAQASAGARIRCAQYLEAQARLAQRLHSQACAGGQGDAASVHQLLALARTNARLSLQLKD